VLVLLLVDGVGNAMLPLVGGVGGRSRLVSPAPLFIGETHEGVPPNETGDWPSGGEAMTGLVVLSEVGVSTGFTSTDFEIDGDSETCSGGFSESLKNRCNKNKFKIYPTGFGKETY
jgi:hypothetical protein